MSTSSPGTGRPRRGRRAAVAAALAIVVALGACEGSNLFENGGAIDVGGSPVVTSLAADGSAREGEIVNVRVKAVGRGGINAVNVEFSGAATATRFVEVDPPNADTVSVTVSVTIPDPAPSAQLRVDATASDEAGRTSAVKTITIPVLDSDAAPGTTGSRLDNP
ncbi:MAG TPA: hypothetical protein VF035_02615 [Longimicrobiales bacterium]